MWQKSHSVITKEVTAAQMWQLFENVNQWHSWDPGIEYARIEGPFSAGNYFTLKPKGGPELKVALLETTRNRSFLDVTKFPLAKMYDNHQFEETSEGLKITNTITVKGPLSFLWVKLVAKNIVNALPEDLPRQIAAARQLPVSI